MDTPEWAKPIVVAAFKMLPGLGVGGFKWWQDPESNRGHKDFQSSALPTELSCPKGKGRLRPLRPGGRRGFCDAPTSNGARISFLRRFGLPG